MDIENYGFFRDIKTMIMTVLAILGKDYEAVSEEKEESAV